MACSVEELLDGPEIDLVVNLTVPTAHAQVSLAAVAAGKHVYGEKPLAVRREYGDAILRAAKKKGVAVGCAPVTGRHIILRTTCERPAAVPAPGSR